MESASQFDVMRGEESIDAELYAQGIALLERIVRETHRKRQRRFGGEPL